MPGPRSTAFVVLASLAGSGSLIGQDRATADSVIALVGPTVFDGTGSQARPDQTIIVRGARISAVGPRSTTAVPRNARVIDLRGKYVTPGFTDVNVHLSLYSGHEAMVRYQDRMPDLVIEMAQRHLKAGVTTVRDSYGMLEPLIAARDRIARGEVAGPRMLVAGNIVGWGGPWSLSATGRIHENLTLFQEQMNDAITQGMGEELIHLRPDSLARLVDWYLGKGPDFLKYGATTHDFSNAFLLFSDQAQRAMVEAVHRNGLVAETHAGSLEGLRMALDAGVDLVQHPEIQSVPLPRDLIQRMVDQRVVCAIIANMITGVLAPAEPRPTATRADAGSNPRPRTGAELRREAGRRNGGISRANAQALINGGCTVAVASDALPGTAPEFDRGGSSPWAVALAPGNATLLSIEGLVDLGMTPAQSLVAATRNGAIAAKTLNDYGTIEVGKYADLLVLTADPLADIRNIRTLERVMKSGRLMLPESLPSNPVWGRQ